MYDSFFGSELTFKQCQVDDPTVFVEPQSDHQTPSLMPSFSIITKIQEPVLKRKKDKPLIEEQNIDCEVEKDQNQERTNDKGSILAAKNKYKR